MRIVATATRPELAHRYRNKLKPLENVVSRDANWADVAVRDCIVANIRGTDGALIAKSKVTR
jgi:hypothetical protein